MTTIIIICIAGPMILAIWFIRIVLWFMNQKLPFYSVRHFRAITSVLKKHAEYFDKFSAAAHLASLSLRELNDRLNKILKEKSPYGKVR